VARNRRKFLLNSRRKPPRWWWILPSLLRIARELNVNETTLGNWVKEYRESHAEDEPALPMRSTPPVPGIRHALLRVNSHAGNAS